MGSRSRISATIHRFRLWNWTKCIAMWVIKKHCWIWFAVDRHGKRFIDCILGARGTVTGEKLWLNLKHKASGAVMTDHGKAYAEFIPKTQHIQSKAKTFTIEGYNSLRRHFLGRLRQKTKCYSKSLAMLEYSMRLLMAKWNKQLPIHKLAIPIFFISRLNYLK